jgi:hypothetical protein
LIYGGLASYRFGARLQLCVRCDLLRIAASVIWNFSGLICGQSLAAFCVELVAVTFERQGYQIV